MSGQEKHPTVGELIEHARLQHGDSYRRAALALGVTDRMVKQWEANFAVPTWDRATTIAGYCGVSRAEVLRRLGVISDEEAEALGGYHAAAA